MSSYYHYHAKVISRSGDKCVSAASAYITGKVVKDERTGQTFSYPRPEGGVLAWKVMLPSNVDGVYGDVQNFATTLEQNEDRIIGSRFKGHADPDKNQKSMARKAELLAKASTGYECIIALPKELTSEQKIALSEQLGEALFVTHRLMVLYAVHDDEKNPHVHMIASMRAIDEEGNFSNAKHRYPRTVLKEMRQTVAEVINSTCQGWGYNIHVDHRSLEAQGVNRLATKHRGWYGSKLKGKSRIGLENEEIEAANEKIILKSPEELIKAVMSSKVLFTEERLKDSLERYMKTPENRKTLVHSLLNDYEEGKLDCVLAQNLARYRGLKDQDRFVLTEAMKERLGLALLSLSETVQVGSKHQMLKSDSIQEEEIQGHLKTLAESSLKQRSIWQRAKSAAFNLGHQVALSAGAPPFMKTYVTETFGERRPANLETSVLGFRSTKGFIRAQEERQGFRFNEGQVQAIEHLCTEKRLSVLLGRAGTGKSSVLSLVKTVYESQGYEVRGAGFQGRVAEALTQEQGISSTTLHKLEYEWNEILKLEAKGDADSLRKADWKKKRYGFNEKTVLILDEVSMAPGYLLSRVLKELNETGGKAILVGDPDQLKEIGRGNAGRLAFEHKETVCELKTILRQKKGGDREATSNLSKGKVKQALEHYSCQIHSYGVKTDVERSGREVNNETNPQDARAYLEDAKSRDTVQGEGESKNQLIVEKESSRDNASLTPYMGAVSGYLNDLEAGRSSLMIATRQEDVDALNNLVRTSLKAQGKLGPEVTVKGQSFYVGDRVLFRQNDFAGWKSQILKGEGVICNGTLGRVMGAVEDHLLVRLDSGAEAKVDMNKYGRVDLGYAITGHLSQGITVPHTHVQLNEGSIPGDLLYVMLSRHTESVQIHMPRSFASNLNELMEKVRAPGDVMGAHDLERLEYWNRGLYDAIQVYEEAGRSIQFLQKQEGLPCRERKEVLKDLYKERRESAQIIEADWDQAKIYMHDAGVSLDRIQRQASGQYPLDLGTEMLMKEFELCGSPEDTEKRGSLAVHLSGLMEINRNIRAGIYGASLETGCQIIEEAGMMTYRGLLKGYHALSGQIEALKEDHNDRALSSKPDETLKALYEQRDKAAAAVLESIKGPRRGKHDLEERAFERLKDQGERHLLRESLDQFKNIKLTARDTLLTQPFDKEAAQEKIQAATQAVSILQDKADLETGRLLGSHYAILKEHRVQEHALKSFAETPLKDLQKAHYTLRPEGTHQKTLYLKRQAALRELTQYKHLEDQKASISQAQKISPESKKEKVQEISLIQEPIAHTLIADHQRLTKEQYVLMGLNQESVKEQALRHQVRELINAYEQDKTPETLKHLKELCLDNNREVKKPVRSLLYEKGLYGDLFPKEKTPVQERTNPRELLDLVSDRVDLMRMAKDLIPEELTSVKGHELRFRKNQSLVVSPRGWKDFMTDEGGRAYSLAHLYGGTSTYKETLSLLAEYTDAGTRSYIDQALGGSRHTLSAEQEERLKEEAKALKEIHAQREAEQKQEKIHQVRALYNRSSSIEGTVAEAYLKGRGISSDLLEKAQNLRFTDQMYNTETKQNDHSALLAFARDRTGEITGVQVTYLRLEGTKDTSLETPKKSMGVIKGAAVKLTPYTPGAPLLVAEGVETGLSLVQGGAQANVVAALGISNVKTVIEEQLFHEAEHFRMLKEQGFDPVNPVLSLTQVDQEMNALKTEAEKLDYIDQKEPLFGINWGSKLLELGGEKGEGANVFFDLLPAEIAETYHPEVCLGIQDQTFTLKQYEALIQNVLKDEGAAQRIDTLMKNTFGESWQERQAQIQDTAAPHENIYHKLMGPEAMRTHAAPTQVVVALDNDRDPSDPCTPKVQEERLRSALDTLSHKTGTSIETLQPSIPGADYNDLLQEKGGLADIKADLQSTGLEKEPDKGRDRDRERPGPELEM